jgi:predicted nucleic acid-binding protein
VTLTDTGPLVALINRNDPNHARSPEAAQHLPQGPLVTSWPCFTEAMDLLHRAAGHAGQAVLWRWRSDGRLILLDLTTEEVDRMSELMAKYHDRPMDLADASLVVAAERLGTKRIFTLDKDFHIYRLSDGTALLTVP